MFCVILFSEKLQKSGDFFSKKKKMHTSTSKDSTEKSNKNLIEKQLEILQINVQHHDWNPKSSQNFDHLPLDNKT